MRNESNTDAGRRFSVLMENDSGVMKAIVEAVPVEHGLMFRLIGSVPQSGSLRPTDTDQLVEAIKLMQWCHDHSEVFEGITSPDAASSSESA
ncbi:MAG: hypothetical protein AB8G99_09800 [Planctomycetaceae bacterium]